MTTDPFEVDCSFPDKIKYPKRDWAKKALKRMIGRGLADHQMCVYPCGNHWHLGHASASYKAEARERRHQ